MPNNFLKEVANRYPVLPQDEIDALVLKGDYDSVVLHNMLLVPATVNKFCKETHRNFEDCISEGIKGLYKAAKKFDPAMGYKFSTYARAWVRQRAYSYYVRASRCVAPPVNAPQLRGGEHRRVFNLITQQNLEGKKNLTYEDISGGGLTYQSWFTLMNSKVSTLSLNLIGDSSLTSLVEHLSGEYTENASSSSENEDTMAALYSSLKTLSTRERAILGWRFFNNLPLKRIAVALNLSRERVRQIEEGALYKLKIKLKRKGLDTPHLQRRGETFLAAGESDAGTT